jgi:hypothetical protein
MLTTHVVLTMTCPDPCIVSVASKYRCKFTGKERDSESGLDMFGAPECRMNFKQQA